MSASGGGLVFKMIGGLVIFFGITDFILYRFFDYDLTGVSWSPIAAWIVGSIVMKIGR